MLNLSAKLKNSYVIENETPATRPVHQALQRQNSQPEPVNTLERRCSISSAASSTSDYFGRSNSEGEHLKRMLATNMEKYNHLLIAKVKDTQLMFGFIVEASVIDVPAG